MLFDLKFFTTQKRSFVKMKKNIAQSFFSTSRPKKEIFYLMYVWKDFFMFLSLNYTSQLHSKSISFSLFRSLLILLSVCLSVCLSINTARQPAIAVYCDQLTGAVLSLKLFFAIFRHLFILTTVC